MKLTHFVLLKTIVGQQVYVGIAWNGTYWVDSASNKYDPENGKQVNSNFGVIDVETISKYYDSNNNTEIEMIIDRNKE